MIWIRPDAPDGVVAVRADGTVRAADYREILRPALRDREDGGKVRLVYELGDEFRRLSPGALWQDVRLGAWLWSRLGRLAVVSDRFWVRGFATAFRLARPGRVRVFPVARRDDALAWAATTSAGYRSRS